jgi:DNA-directed RNA polymerase III subunit RPC2
MLRSDRCVLNGKPEAEVIRMKECLHDPGGYFIVKGAERIILIQEKLAMNRALLDKDGDRLISASIVSSNNEYTRRCVIYLKNQKVSIQLSTHAPIIFPAD